MFSIRRVCAVAPSRINTARLAPPAVAVSPMVPTVRARGQWRPA
jgi:hypothetical protein